MSLLSSEKVYCLQLANGNEWNLVATKGTEFWVDRFASIMGFRPCEMNECPKLIVAESEIDEEKYKEPVYIFDSSLRKGLPNIGWKTRTTSTGEPDVSIRFWYHDDAPDVILHVEQDEGHEEAVMRMWSLVYFMFEREQFFGGVPLHAGLIEKEGKGILLSASGGVGKSTCCKRIPSPWQSLSDDQTLIVLDHQSRYIAHPFPTWSEYLWKRSEPTWNVENHVPLSAIFFLKRAEEDRVISVKPHRAAIVITESAIQACIVGITIMGKEEQSLLKRRLFHNSCDLAKTVPAYNLEVSLHGRFWEEIEKVL